MAGTKVGGQKAAATNKRLYGDDFYITIGTHGGSTPRIGVGFASLKIGRDGLTGQERAKIAGKKGGASGRRRK